MKYEYFSKVLKKKYFQVFKKNYKNTKAWKLAFVSSIFKYFLKSPKNRKIRVCLKILRVCHYYGFQRSFQDETEVWGTFRNNKVLYNIIFMEFL
jgi:hypothetical protein